MNEFGPLHEYVAPTTGFDVRFKLDPEQIGLLLLATGAAGVGFTTTETVAGALEHPLKTVTVYVPLAAVVALGIVGFWFEDVNPFGPAQVYVAPAIVSAFNCNVWPAQTGVLEVTFGEGGLLLTRTTTVPATLVHPATVTVSE